MELVLWRHAEAENAASSDLARKLTPAGQQQADKMAHWFCAQINEDWAAWRVLASPANRAQQTATALGRPIRTVPTLAPEASVEAVLAASGWPEGLAEAAKIVIVGHQPTIGNVVAHLTDGRAGHVAVRTGAMWWFVTRERDGVVQTILKAVATPDTV